MRSKNNNKLKLFSKAIINGLLIFLMGFCVMYILWEFNVKSPALRGFDYYLTAFWGDRICLPIFTASTSIFIMGYEQLKKKYIMISLVVGGIATLLAIAIQMSWLISDYTVLNWTIPRQHHFNIAGWYHAVFFTIMFFIVGYAMARIWFIRYSLTPYENTLQEDILFSIVIAAGSGFIYLYGIDNYTTKYSIIYILIILYFTIMISLVFFCITSRKNTLYRDLLVIICGESVSLGIVISCLSQNLNINYLLLSCTAALFSISLVKPDCVQPANSKMRFILISLPTFSISYAFFTLPRSSLFEIAIMISMVVIVPLVIGICLKENGEINIRTVSFIFFTPTYVIIPLLVEYIYGNEWKTLINIIMTATIYKLCKSYISNYLFNLVIENEQKINSSQEQDGNVKSAVYFNIIIIALANFIYFAMLIVWSPQSGLNNLKVEIPVWDCRNMFFIFMLVFIMMGLTILKKVKRNVVTNIFSLILLSFGYTILALEIYLLRGPFLIDWRIWILIFPIIGSSLMLSKGYYTNTVKLCNLKGIWFDKLSICIVFVGTIVNAIVTILPTYRILDCRNNPIMYFISSMMGILIAYMVFPSLFSRIHCYTRNGTPLIRSSAVAGVTQDGFTSALIALISGLIPAYYSMILPTHIITLFFGIGMLITTISWPFSYCLKNNQDHYKRKQQEYIALCKESILDRARLDRQMNALKNHLAFQNFVTYFSAFPYLLPCDVVRIINNLISKKMLLHKTLLIYAFIQPEVSLKKYEVHECTGELDD